MSQDKLLQIVKHIIIEMDMLNGGKPLDFKKLIGMFHDYDQTLVKTLKSSDLSPQAKRKLLASTSKVITNLRNFLRTSYKPNFKNMFANDYRIQGINHLFEWDGKAYSGTDNSIKKHSKFITKYNEIAQIDPKKAGPVWAVLRDYSENLEKKVMIYSGFIEFENHILKVMDCEDITYLSQLSEQDFIAKKNSKILPNINHHKNTVAIEYGGKPLLGKDKTKYWNDVLKFYHSKNPNEFNAKTMYKELLETGYFNPNLNQRYISAYTQYQENITKKLAGEVLKGSPTNAGGYHYLANITANDITPLKTPGYNEELMKIKNTRGLAHITSKSEELKQITSFCHDHNPHMTNFWKHHRPFTRLEEPVSRGYGSFEIDTKTPTYQKVKKFSTANFFRSRKLSALKRVTSRIVLGPELFALDLFGIALPAFVMAGGYISQKIGWSEKPPAKYSVAYYDNKAKALMKRKANNELIIASSANAYGIKSQQAQMLEKQQYLVDAAIELAVLNKRTTQYCSFNTHKANEAMIIVSNCTSQLYKLKHKYDMASEYERLKKMTPNIYASESMMETYAPYVSVKPEVVKEKMKPLMKKLLDAQNDLYLYQNGLAKIMLEDSVDELKEAVVKTTPTLDSSKKQSVGTLLPKQS